MGVFLGIGKLIVGYSLRGFIFILKLLYLKINKMLFLIESVIWFYVILIYV